MNLAYYSAAPQDYFMVFLLLFIVIFVLGWTSAVAAYGAFVAPRVMGDQIEAGSPELAMYGFAVFYAICVLVCWWFYLRPGAEIKNP